MVRADVDGGRLLDQSTGVDCLGAGLSSSGTPVVMTAQGFGVGGTVAKLKGLYGAQLMYVNNQVGYAPTVGYVLREPTGVLLFREDSAGRIVEIAAAADVDHTIAC